MARRGGGALGASYSSSSWPSPELDEELEEDWFDDLLLPPAEAGLLCGRPEDDVGEIDFFLPELLVGVKLSDPLDESEEEPDSESLQIVMKQFIINVGLNL